MASLNQCNFIGRLGREPENRTTQGGKTVCSFSIAIDEKWGDKKHTEWVNIVTWEKLADICSMYLHKGSLVLASGRIQTRTYDDKEGVKRYVTEIVASNIQMLDKKTGGEGKATEAEEAPF